MASTTLAAVDLLVVDDAGWRRVFDFCCWMMLCVFFLTSSFSCCACGWRIWECGLLVFLWGPCLAYVVLEACHIMQHQQLNDAFCKFVISNKFCFRLKCLFQRSLFSIQFYSCSRILQHHWTTWRSARALNFGQTFFWFSCLRFVCERIVFRM